MEKQSITIYDVAKKAGRFNGNRFTGCKRKSEC